MRYAARQEDDRPDTARVGVHNLPHAVSTVTGVNGHLVLLAAQVGQAACRAAVLAARLCRAPVSM